MYFYNVLTMCRQCTAAQTGRAEQCNSVVLSGRWCNVRTQRSSAQCSGSVPLGLVLFGRWCARCNVIYGNGPGAAAQIGAQRNAAARRHGAMFARCAM